MNALVEQFRSGNQQSYERHSSEKPEDSSPPVGQFCAQSKNSRRDRTILVKIHLELYLISWEILEKVFSPFGFIEYLEVFCRGEEFHSKIRFRSKASAIEAFEFLNQRNIYDRCCLMELFLKSSINPLSSSNQLDVASDKKKISESPTEESPKEPTTEAEIIFSDDWETRRLRIQENIRQIEALVEESEKRTYELEVQASIEESVQLDWAPIQEIDDKNQAVQVPLDSEAASTKGNHEPSLDVEFIEDPDTRNKPSELNSYSLNQGVVEAPSIELIELVTLLIEWMEIRLENNGFVLDSSEILSFDYARKLFDEMPDEKIVLFRPIPGQIGHLIFDSGIASFSLRMGYNRVVVPALFNFKLTQRYRKWMPFDRGRVALSLVDGKLYRDNYLVQEEVEAMGNSGVVVFDPGGVTRHCCLVDVQVNRHRHEILGLALDLKLVKNGLKALPFDRGGLATRQVEAKVDCNSLMIHPMGDAIVGIEKFCHSDIKLCWGGFFFIFDPGGTVIDCLGVIPYLFLS